MPARKPATLINSADTKANKAARASAEAALTPRTALSIKPPASLNGHKEAVAVWKYTLKLYGETQGTIVTGFDLGIMTDYCLMVEQLVELETLRRQSFDSCALVRKSLNAITAKIKAKDAKQILAEQLAVNEKLESILDLIIKLDARIDRKRSLIHTLRQSLYLTPRSRAGVAPTEREEEEKDEMTKLLEEVTA